VHDISSPVKEALFFFPFPHPVRTDADWRPEYLSDL